MSLIISHLTAGGLFGSSGALLSSPHQAIAQSIRFTALVVDRRVDEITPAQLSTDPPFEAADTEKGERGNSGSLPNFAPNHVGLADLMDIDTAVLTSSPRASALRMGNLSAHRPCDGVDVTLAAAREKPTITKIANFLLGNHNASAAPDDKMPESDDTAGKLTTRTTSQPAADSSSARALSSKDMTASIRSERLVDGIAAKTHAAAVAVTFMSRSRRFMADPILVARAVETAPPYAHTRGETEDPRTPDRVEPEGGSHPAAPRHPKRRSSISRQREIERGWPRA